MGEGGTNIDDLEDHDGGYSGKSPAGGEQVYRLQARRRGRLDIPPELVRVLGLEPEAEVEARFQDGRVEIRPNIHSLARLYVEPTARCNLTCETCVRNTWREPMGDMSPEVFERLLSQLGRFPHLRSVMFGGFGEPTAHPGVVAMISGVKRLGLRAEMVTNGTLLDGALAEGIAGSGLDTLWVSFDGASETSYEAIRVGADYPGVVANVRRLRHRARELGRGIEIGIAFVVMQKNVEELQRIDHLIKAVRARRVSVSNVLPYSPDMEKQMVCRVALSLELFSAAAGRVEVRLPRLDVNVLTRDTIISLLQGHNHLTLMGNPVRTDIQSCRFIRERCTFVRWDGKVSPCMGLLHPHTTFLHGNERRIEPYFLGDVSQESLGDVWSSETYRAFREKVSAFDFSPCHACGGCNLVDANSEDCFGNTFPACGGCLWAQGIIQCP